MSIRKPMYLTALATVAATLATAAYAGDQMSNGKASDEMKPQKSTFSVIDENADGSISVLEAHQKNQWVSKNFNTIDTNKDGRISKEEYDKALS